MSTTSPHSYSNYFYGSVFFSRDPLCIRCFWVREVGSGAGLVWHVWFGEERSGYVVLSGMGRTGHHPHTRHAPRHPLSLSSCEHSLVSRFLSVVHLLYLVCRASLVSCVKFSEGGWLSVSLVSALLLSSIWYFSLSVRPCVRLCVSVCTSVRACPLCVPNGSSPRISFFPLFFQFSFSFLFLFHFLFIFSSAQSGFWPQLLHDFLCHFLYHLHEKKTIS